MWGTSESATNPCARHRDTPPRFGVGSRGGYGWPAALLLERDAELARVADALGFALAGRGDVLVIAGTPGIGKSRLMDEVRAAA